MCKVLLVASRTENVDQRVDAGALAGLDTKIADVEAMQLNAPFNGWSIACQVNLSM